MVCLSLITKFLSEEASPFLSRQPDSTVVNEGLDRRLINILPEKVGDIRVVHSLALQVGGTMLTPFPRSKEFLM